MLNYAVARRLSSHQGEHIPPPPGWFYRGANFTTFISRLLFNQIGPSCLPVGQESLFGENRLCRPHITAHFQPDLLHCTNLGSIPQRQEFFKRGGNTYRRRWLPGVCPRCGSALRSPPRICSRGTKQHDEPLRKRLSLRSHPTLTINWHFSCPCKVNLVPNYNDSFGVEVTGLPQALEQGLCLLETVKVSDAEDDEDAVAVLNESLLLLSFHLGAALAEHQLALLLLQLHRHTLLFTTSANLCGESTCKACDAQSGKLLLTHQYTR